LNAIPVTAVGNDVLGLELRRRLEAWDVDTGFVATLLNKPTGTVQVELDSRGSPSFDIVENAAWDYIPVSARLLQQASRSWAIVFGSLAQRSAHNRRTLAALLEAAPRAHTIFDVNLRAPFNSPKIVWPLARQASLIKLNEQELAFLLKQPVTPARLEKAARVFSEKTGCVRICVTAGSRGAGLLLGENWYWEPARKIQVKDAVGAGDAFLAAILHALLFQQVTPQKALACACRLAEFVASRDGATPAYAARG
jgi:fructokinase